MRLIIGFIILATAVVVPAVAVPSSRSAPAATPGSSAVATVLVLAQSGTKAAARPDDPEPGDRREPRRTLADEAARTQPGLIDQCLEVAQQLDPKLAERLRSVCDDDQDAFERILRQRGRLLIGLAQLREREPELYSAKVSELRIEMQVNRMASQLLRARRSGDVKAADNLESQLRGLIRIQIALSMKSRGDYIRRLEEHIGALREQLAEQAERFDETVEERLRLISDPNSAPPSAELFDLDALSLDR